MDAGIVRDMPQRLANSGGPELNVTCNTHNSRHLAPGQVDIWLTSTKTLSADTLHCYKTVLSAPELERWQRIIVPDARLQFLIARTLLRASLSQYAAVRPVEWRFETNAYGKPFVANPKLCCDLRFNLSHTKHLVAVAVTNGCEVGVDVEYLRQHVDFVQLAPVVFAPAELNAFRAVPEQQRAGLFWTLWTLKEAYIKALGTGLSCSLDSFAFDVSETHPCISFEKRCTDAPSGWQFRHYALTPEHMLALAVAAPDAFFDARLIWTVPEILYPIK